MLKNNTNVKKIFCICWQILVGVLKIRAFNKACYTEIIRMKMVHLLILDLPCNLRLHSSLALNDLLVGKQFTEQ